LGREQAAFDGTVLVFIRAGERPCRRYQLGGSQGHFQIFSHFSRLGVIQPPAMTIVNYTFWGDRCPSLRDSRLTC